MKKKYWLFLWILTALGLGGGYFNTGFYFQPIKTLEYHVPEGQKSALKKMASTLEREKIIRHRLFFEIFTRILGVDRRLAWGYYDFNNHSSTLDILFKLRSQKTKSMAIPILEGYDLYDIAEKLVELGVIAHRDVFLMASHSKIWIDYFKRESGLPVRHSIEGFIYPDTYLIKKGASFSNLIVLAANNFRKKIVLSHPHLSPQKIYTYLTVASLIEKETSLSEEKPLISSVLHNRLNKDHKLQFDPTVIYTLKKMKLAEKNKKHGKINLIRSHFSIPSPFNTYYTKGLPPTPICSPTLSSFTAALSPKKTHYFFFVAKGQGSQEHIFSRTYVEHLFYVNKYQRSPPGIR